MPRMNPAQQVEEATQLVNILGRISQFSTPSSADPWSEGILHSHLVADGFASRSTSSKPYKHWLYDLAPRIRRVNGYVPCRGFSYSSPGYNYSPLDTRIDFSKASMMVRHYQPRTHLPMTYHAFSLACPLFVLGLADSNWARNLSQRQGSNSNVKANTLILVQPAFLLHQPIIESIHTRNDLITTQPRIEAMPEAINTLAVSSLKFWHPELQIPDPAVGFLDEIVTALRVLTPIMNVRMLYWPGDQFIAYPKGLIDRLARVEVKVQSVNLRFAGIRKTGDSFRHHSEVSRKRRILEEIKAVVAANN